MKINIKVKKLPAILYAGYRDKKGLFLLLVSLFSRLHLRAAKVESIRGLLQQDGFSSIPVC